ncbi:MAG: hypothetical protein FWE35_10835 [Streptosporangiales bacterium]|nr:hypothetical protein [Streptosporangiales bacterium]
MSDMRFRVYVAREVVAEEWVTFDDDDVAEIELAGMTVSERHVGLIEAAVETGKLWLVEVFDPSVPEECAYMRFGTDVDGMTLPFPIAPN